MRPFFYPAIALMKRLSYTRKFALLWLMSLAAVAVVMHSLYVSLDEDIRTSQRELEGLALIKPISQTVRLMQLHRGLTAALLGGNKNLRGWRAAKEKEAVEAFDAMEGKLPPSLTSSADWRNIKANWERLQKEGLKWTVEENFIAHTRLIKQMLLFEVFVADEYALTLDAEIDSYYMIDTSIGKLPEALEYLEQVRAYGIGMLIKKQATEHQNLNINTLAAKLDDTLNALKINIEKTSQYNPMMRDPLSAAFKDIADSAKQIVDLVKSDILTGHFATSPEDFYIKTSAAIDKGYAQLYEALLPTTEALIKMRIARAENELRISVGIALLLILVVAYSAAGIYYATIGSIRSLARSARAFAGGDMRERVDLGTRDELKQVGDSFNEMADGFNALLTVHKEGEARLRATIETAFDAVVQMDAEGIIIGWNNQAEKTFGWTKEEAIGRVLGETIIPPQYREAHAHGMKHFLAAGEGPILNSRVELLGLHRDGHEFPIELSITAVKAAGKYEFNGFIHDITNRKKSEELIWKQANFDTLTGLPNRTLFRDRMEQEIKKAHRTGLKIALLFVDLDRFKEVNDTLGHSMGDLLLVEAARRIGYCVRETDTVARLGGDEFIITLSEIDDNYSIERVAENILQKLAEPFHLGDKVVHVSASMGITLYPDDATEVEELLKDADQAMYVAKNAGRNRLSYFTPALQQAVQTRMHLLNDLRGALAGDQFRVYFQPIVELATGRIHKAEALIRWQHPERGLVSPVEFIPLAEETGLIVEIGDWVFRESARQVKRWRTMHDTGFQISVNMPSHADFQISVNVSPVQFHNAGLYQTWRAYLQELELPGKSITIEITEGLLLDADPSVTVKLLEFHDVGIQVSIDDFGTGYSSLSYLKKFDIDYLKIDQSFTRNLAPGSSDMALSEAIIVMAHKLGLKVIAEGVETEAQHKLLAAAGCDYAQGYLFSRPVPAEEFEALLEHRNTNEYPI